MGDRGQGGTFLRGAQRYSKRFSTPRLPYYRIFYLHSPGYDKSTHIRFKGKGRHIHDDFFVAKLGEKVVCNGANSHVDMPEESLSRKVYGIHLKQTRISIIEMLLM